MLRDVQVLYLDDDAEMRQIVKASLPAETHCDEAGNVKEAIKLVESKTYSIILIDLDLDGESGFDFIQFIKQKEFIFMPIIIILTASQKEEDEVRGHQLEVHEYITKPIKPAVFSAQIDKYVQRLRSETLSLKRVGPLKIDAKRMQVKMDLGHADEDLLLTLKEYKLLMKFIDNPRIPFTREQLYTEVWEASSEIQSRTIDMHVSALRKKLKHFSNSITSVRGIGYLFDPAI